MKDVEIIGMIKSYVQKTLVGMGALKGAPCQVQGVTDEGDGTQTLTLSWKDNDGVTHTTDIELPAAIFAIVSPTNGQTIRYNAVSGKWENSNVSFSANLDDLDDVVITSVQDGQVLTYDAANNRWINADGSTVAALSDLTDVTITTVQNGQLLSYNSASNKWVNVSLTIDDLGHVSITSAQDGQVLTYDAANNVWKNANLPTITVDSALDTTSENPVQNKVIALALDNLSASKIGFDGTTSGLSATDTQSAIDELAGEKVDKETGKGLSQNDFTDALKSKLDDIESNAQVNVIEEVQVNGTALTPDANKAVNIEEKVSKLSDVDLTGLADGYILIYDAANNKWIVGANTGASYTAGEGIEIDQNNVISSKMVLFTGTEAQWNALPLADKIKFTHYATNDDQTGQIDPVPTQNSANLMTSGGIYTALQDKANTSDLGTAAGKDSTNAVTTGSSDLVESGAVDTAITSAIEALDVSDTAVAGSYVTEVSETDGKVSVTREAADATPTASSNKMVKSGGVYASEQDIYKANGVLGAKNLIPFPYAEGTTSKNGLDFTVNSDGSITIDGTSTASNPVFYNLVGTMSASDTILNAGTYIFSNNDNMPSGVTMRIGNANGAYFDITEKEITATFNSDINMYCLIRIAEGATVDNVTFYPMLRLASDTDSTYQPYAKTNKQLTDDSVDWDANSLLGAHNILPSFTIDSLKALNPSGWSGTTRTSNNWSVAVDVANQTLTLTTSAAVQTYTNFVIRTDLLKFLEKDTDYILNGYDSSNSNIRLLIYDRNNQKVLNTWDNMEVPFRISSSATYSTVELIAEARVGASISGSIVMQPMIRLASDNVKEYSSYAMTNQQLTGDMIYSTDEVDTGKIWIDGNRIYRKTIDCGYAPDGSTALSKIIAHGANNVAFFASIIGVAKGDSGATLPVPYTPSNINTKDGLAIYVNNTNIFLVTEGFNFSTYRVYITLEYTKTT